MKCLQTKSQCTVSENGNIVTITTAHSSTRMNNNGLTQPIESSKLKPQIANQIQTVIPKVTNNNGTSTINLSGPVTDL